jgi:hypothetical protein
MRATYQTNNMPAVGLLVICYLLAFLLGGM